MKIVEVEETISSKYADLILNKIKYNTEVN